MDTFSHSLAASLVPALACPTCQSTVPLTLADDQLRCPDCGAAMAIIDGVLDLLQPDYQGYLGDSTEEAVLRDAHDPQVLFDNTARLRRLLAEFLPQSSLILDVGCGTGHLARIISAGHPEATIIATDVSLPMCRLAAKNCSGRPVLVVRAASSQIPPMPFRDEVFDIVLNRLAPMDRTEAWRLLRPGGIAVFARLVPAYWQEISQVFPEERLITFPRHADPTEALFQAGFSAAERHEWRVTKNRSLAEIKMVLQYAPILRDFDETADQPALSKLMELYGDGAEVCLTEGESLLVGRKEG